MDFLGSLNELENRLGNRFIRTHRAYLFKKFETQRSVNVVSSYCQGKSKRGGEHMAKDRFVEVYNQGLVNVAKIIVDTETGVNYLMASHNKANGTGLTVLVDQDGKPVVTPVK